MHCLRSYFNPRKSLYEDLYSSYLVEEFGDVKYFIQLIPLSVTTMSHTNVKRSQALTGRLF